MTKTMDSPPSSSEGSSSSAFNRFSPGVQKWIWKKEWKALHEIQERAADSILTGARDVLISAPTAGGKTEAAFLPIVSCLSVGASASIGSLCVSPLKALINDQHRRLESLCEAASVPLHRWHGDVPQSQKNRVLAEPRGVLLITPESLEANFVRRGTRLKALFSDVAFVVIDELHAFIGNERGRQLQSLLTRLEIVAARSVPRIGLSATLGDMMLAAEFLRPGGGADVIQIKGTSGGSELKAQVRGYRRRQPTIGAPDDDVSAVPEHAKDDDEVAVGDLHEIASHLFKVLRGKDNLIFANSRGRVEFLADVLRRKCEAEKVPNEFLPHHGSLSKELREDAEELLRDKTRPGNVLATTTLEMGIDVGSIDSIAQVGVPPSVASLRQRLGRSGRREGQASVLRMYVVEQDQPGEDSPQDRLRASIVQTIAMLDLLLEGWCEPPIAGRFHYSTLVQQVLAVIAQYGGVRADEACNALCRRGPFRNVDAARFQALLRELGKREYINQANDGTLVLGVAGERIVDHYDFFAAFASTEEFRLVHRGRTLGSLPVTRGLMEGEHVIFGGRRWKVVAVDAEAKVVTVEASKGGRPPLFEGSPFSVHDAVRRKMFEIYRSTTTAQYLDKGAQQLLKEGRDVFGALELGAQRLVSVGNSIHIYPWVGDRGLHTIELVLRAKGLEVANEGISLSVKSTTRNELVSVFRDLLGVAIDGPGLVAEVRGQASEKYDAVLPAELLAEEYAARELDIAGAVVVMRELALGTAVGNPD